MNKREKIKQLKAELYTYESLNGVANRHVVDGPVSTCQCVACRVWRKRRGGLDLIFGHSSIAPVDDCQCPVCRIARDRDKVADDLSASRAEYQKLYGRHERLTLSVGIVCEWCDTRLADGDDDVAKTSRQKHLLECEKHPMSELRLERDLARAQRGEGWSECARVRDRLDKLQAYCNWREDDLRVAVQDVCDLQKRLNDLDECNRKPFVVDYSPNEYCIRRGCSLRRHHSWWRRLMG